VKAQCVMIVPAQESRLRSLRRVRARIRAVSSRRGVGRTSRNEFRRRQFRFPIGGESTDIMMLVMNRSGMEELAADKFTIGGDVSAAAGPVGRTSAAGIPPMKTLTSQVRSPLGIICPALPAIVPNLARIVAHNWHTVNNHALEFRGV
jgi:hypothetical protein